MIIDLSRILKDEGGSIDVNGRIDFCDTQFMGDEFSFPDGLDVCGKISNNTKSLHFTAKVSGRVIVPCARCLKPVEKPVEFKVSEILIKEDQQDHSDDDVIIFTGESIDIDEIIMNNFLMNVPGKYLCKDDCKGLCPKCGKDLNLGDCGCSDEEIDPRWAALEEIMKNSDTE